MESPSIATDPLAGGQGEMPKVRLPKRKMRGSSHQCLFEENVRKTKKRSVNFENKGLGVVYAWGKVSAPHAPVIRDDSL